MAKRPKYVNDLVEMANERFRQFGIKRESNDLFVFITTYLLDKNMYDGFGYYKVEYNESIGKYVIVGSSYKDYEFLRIH